MIFVVCALVLSSLKATKGSLAYLKGTGNVPSRMLNGALPKQEQLFYRPPHVMILTIVHRIGEENLLWESCVAANLQMCESCLELFSCILEDSDKRPTTDTLFLPFIAFLTFSIIGLVRRRAKQCHKLSL